MAMGSQLVFVVVRNLIYFESLALQAGWGDYGHSRRCCEGSGDEPTNRQVCVSVLNRCVALNLIN